MVKHTLKILWYENFMFDHFPTLWIKGLRYFIFNDYQSTTAIDPRKKICYYDTDKLYQNNCFLSSSSVSSEKSETL